MKQHRQIRKHLWGKLWDTLGKQMATQINNDVSNSIWSRLGYNIVNPFDVTIKDLIGRWLSFWESNETT